MNLLRKFVVFLLDAVQTFILAASVFVVIYIFLFRPFQVSGQSMYPTFYDKEYVLTNLIALRIEDIKRGDVIVFQAPKDAEKDYIKRVIGLPGDTVLIQNGEVSVDGKKLDESAYLKNEVKTYAGSFLRDNEPVSVPQEEYFVMGDNRSYSSDSREFGPIKKTLIIGKSMLVYWPANRVRTVVNPFLK